MKFKQTALVVVVALSSTSLYAVESNPEKDVFFGTTHGHSSWLIDAFGSGNQKSGPEDGYRYPRGEAVTDIRRNLMPEFPACSRDTRVVMAAVRTAYGNRCCAFDSTRRTV